MPKLHRVIKQRDVHRVAPKTADAAHLLGRALRLPESAVTVVEKEDRPERPPSAPVRSVLRRDGVEYVEEPRTITATATPPEPMPVPAAPPPPPAPPKEERLTREAVAALRAEWDAEWEERLRAAAEEAREEGREEGYAAAQADLQEEIQGIYQAFTDSAENLRGLWKTFLQETEPLLVELAVSAAEAVLEAPLPEEIERIAEQGLVTAVEQLSGEAPVDIRLHPVDLLHLEENAIVEQLRSVHPRLTWHADPDMERGDWVVQSPTSAVRRLRDEMRAALRVRLGLGEAPAA